MSDIKTLEAEIKALKAIVTRHTQLLRELRGQATQSRTVNHRWQTAAALYKVAAFLRGRGIEADVRMINGAPNLMCKENDAWVPMTREQAIQTYRKLLAWRR